MNNERKNKIVPTLRFPEFKDSEGWIKKTLIDLAIDGFSNGVFNDPKKVGCGYKLINVLDMYLDIPIDEHRLSLIDISYSEFLKNKVVFGDIFFTRSSLVAAGIAQSNIYLGTSDDITFDGHLIRLRPDTEIIEPVFLHYALKTEKVRSQLIAKGKTATMTTIGQSDIATTLLSIPLPIEQKKIFNCLSSLDELITAHIQELEALKAHKKGLMQQLFPAEGETVPKLRFSEFKDAWKIKKVGELCDWIVPGRNKPKSFSGSIPWITTPDISHHATITESQSHLAVSLEEAKSVGSRIVPTDSVIISCVGDLGLVALAGRELVINQQLHAFLPSNKINNRFLLYSLSLQSDYMWRVATKTAVAYLNKDNCNSIPVIFPSAHEQQKIADCLSSLDELLGAQTEKIEELKMHKKGLMQGLFPIVLEN